MGKGVRFLLFFLFLFLGGCGPDPEYFEQPIRKSTLVHHGPFQNGVHRIEDREAGVVCWVYEDGYGAGISCLPFEETKLERETLGE